MRRHWKLNLHRSVRGRGSTDTDGSRQLLLQQQCLAINNYHNDNSFLHSTTLSDPLRNCAPSVCLCVGLCIPFGSLVLATLSACYECALVLLLGFQCHVFCFYVVVSTDSSSSTLNRLNQGRQQAVCACVCLPFFWWFSSCLMVARLLDCG